MVGNIINWYKTTQLLGIISDEEKSQGWPDCFTGYEIALMQTANDTDEAKNIALLAFVDAIQLTLTSTLTRKPLKRDLGREPYLTDRNVMAAALYPNSPELSYFEVKLYHVKEVANFLNTNNVSPSELIQAWINATLQGNVSEPWLNPDANDPEPDQAWYTPARYFARQIAKEHPKYTNKQIAELVVPLLLEHKIYGRFKDKQYEYTTVLKALTGVKLK